MLLSASALMSALVVPVSAAVEAPTRPQIPIDRESTEQAMQRDEAVRKERGSAQAQERRRRSRTAFRGLDRAAAVRLANDKHAALAQRPLGPQLKLLPEQELIRFLGPRAALVDVGERRVVVDSTVPLAVREGDEWQPADLDLVASGTEFVARRPLVDVRVPARAGGLASIGSDLAVTPLRGASGSGAALSDGRVFWPGAATDTDVLAMPVPAGLEVAYFLRSPEAREDLALGLSLPDGAVAERGLEPGSGVRITRDGKVVARVSQPVAIDAGGKSLPVQYAVRDGDLVMHVDHRAEDVEYPIAVDPAVELEQEWQNWHNGKDGWWTVNVNGWWNYASWDVGAGDGLNIWHDAGSFPAWWAGDWARTTPGNSYIDSLNVRSVQWWLSGSCIFIGISRYAGGGYPFLARYEDCRAERYTINNGYFYGVGPMYPTERVEDKNYVVLRHHTGGVDGDRGFHLTHWGNVEVWYSDWTAPSGPSASGFPGGWVDPSKTATNWTVSGTDAGVGVKTVTVDGDWGAGVEWTNTHGCTGNYDNLCNTTRIDSGPDYKPDGRHSATGNLSGAAEGEWPVYGTIRDLVGRASARTRVATARIDRTAPGVTLSGSLYDARGTVLTQQSSTLRVAATDGSAGASTSRSGVKSIEILTKRTDETAFTRRFFEQQPAATNASMTRDWTFDRSQYADGDYTVKTVVRDNLDHVKESTFTVTVVAPPVSGTAPLVTGTPRDGQRLSGTNGTWTSTRPITYTYRWQSCVAGVCANLTGETEPFVDLVQEDLASQLKLVVVASNDGGSTTATSALTNAVLGVVPTVARAPEVYGEAYEGQTLSVVKGTYAGTGPFTYVNKWQRCLLICVDITGATGYEYNLVAADVNATVRVVQTATSPTGSVVGTTAQTQLVGPASLAPADETPGQAFAEEAVVTDADYQRALRFRTSFGLRTDETYVRNVLASSATEPAAAEAEDAYGTPLTAAERRDLDLRDRVHEQVPTIDTWAAANAATTFAGVYIDQQAGGLVRVAFTSNAASSYAALKQAFPYPSRLRLFSAQFSEQHLTSVESAITGDLASLAAAGITVDGLGIRTELNRVEVGVIGLTTAKETELRTRYGDAVRAVEAEEAVTADSHFDKRERERAARDARQRPLKAGLRITPRNRNIACTSGFMTRDDVSRNGIVVGEANYVITAGHCVPTETEFDDDGEEWLQGRRFMGRHFGSNTYKDGSESDAGLILIDRGISSTSIYTARNRRRVVTSKKAKRTTRHGEKVCVSGAASGVTECGAVDLPSYRKTYGGKTINELSRTDFNCRRGDSGGPAYRADGRNDGARAMGIVAAITPKTKGAVEGKCWYSQIGHIEDALNVTVRQE